MYKRQSFRSTEFHQKTLHYKLVQVHLYLNLHLGLMSHRKTHGMCSAKLQVQDVHTFFQNAQRELSNAVYIGLPHASIHPLQAAIAAIA